MAILIAVASGWGCALPASPPTPADVINRRLDDAARRNDVPALEALFREGVTAEPVPVAGSERVLPLHRAIEGGHLEATQLLIRHGADVDRRPTGDWGETPLMVACRFGHAAIVSALLQAGANAFAEHGPYQLDGVGGGSGQSAMDMATTYGHAEVVRLLLLHGVKTNSFHVYQAIGQGHGAELLRLVLRGGASAQERFRWNGRTPLEEAQRLPPSDRRAKLIEVLRQFR